MTGMKVTLKSTNVTKEGYIKSKISAIMKTIIVKYIKILKMLDFLFFRINWRHCAHSLSSFDYLDIVCPYMKFCSNLFEHCSFENAVR
jgi:hypothetical protein